MARLTATKSPAGAAVRVAQALEEGLGANLEFETVAASQTAQAIGATGAAGDYIHKLIVIPATVAPGVVTLLDNSTAVMSYVGGGTTALLSVTPFTIELGLRSVSGAWKITTGANVSVIAVGDFT